LQTLGTIAFEDRAVEILEGEERRRWPGIGAPSAAQDFIPGLKNLIEDSRVVRLFRAGRARSRQQ
jgi:hypothetical protein